MSVELGRSDMFPLGFGAASIGNLYRQVEQSQADAALEAAWEGGIRYFDTAPHYGLGLSERRLGAFLRQKPREDVVLSTKVGRLLVPNPEYSGGRDLDHDFDVPNDLMRRYDPSEAGIRRSIHESLERLGMDHIDIAYLHDPDVYDLERGLGEGLPALEALRQEGLIRQIGIGVNDAAVATRAAAEADLDLVMVAGQATLLRPHGFDELSRVCAARGTKIVAAAPYNSGLLSTPHPQPGARLDYKPVPDDVLDQVEQLARTCERFDVELPAAAMQFPLRLPQVVSVVAGTARPAQVRQNTERMSAHIPAELWEALP